MKLIEPKLSYIEKTTFDECLKEMKFQDIHIDHLASSIVRQI